MASGSQHPQCLAVVTGPPGVGKTTLVSFVAQALLQRDVKVTGFTTQEVRQGVRRQGFDIVDLAGNRAVLARVGDEFSHGGPHVGQYSVAVPSFEQVALPALQLPPSGPRGVLVIDEVGKMELFSRPFVSKVEQLLSQPDVTLLVTIPVAGRGKPLALVEHIRRHSSATLFEVTRGNRDDLVSEVTEFLMASQRTS